MKVIKLFMVAFACIMLASCGSENAENVVKKLQNGEKPKVEDYTVMINYLGNYAEKAQVFQDVIDNSDTPDSPEAVKAAKQLSELTSESKYVSLFNQALSDATPEEVGEENVKLIDKYAALIWFTAPDWAEISTSPDDEAGLLLETPDTEDGVIAGAVDSIKEVK